MLFKDYWENDVKRLLSFSLVCFYLAGLCAVQCLILITYRNDLQ